VDHAACEKASIRVSGVDDYCTEEVADHTIALMLTILRSTRLDARLKAGEWPGIGTFPEIRRLSTLSLGLLGLGRIATAVASRARAFGLTVRAYDPFLTEEQITSRGATPAGIEAALASDIVSLHLPLAPDTVHVIDERRLHAMKPGAILINVSRGGLIDEEALRAALDTGHIAAAGLDVFAKEQPSTSLAMHPLVLATPHVGYYSRESLAELRTQAAETVAALLESHDLD
jgi:D-3-phosphoglycerate dehydrogenase